jgi:hypothetical protein
MSWLSVTIVALVSILILVVASYVWMKIDAVIERRRYMVGPFKTLGMGSLSTAGRLVTKPVFKVYVWWHKL